jgi:hypothetical protein
MVKAKLNKNGQNWVLSKDTANDDGIKFAMNGDIFQQYIMLQTEYNKMQQYFESLSELHTEK